MKGCYNVPCVLLVVVSVLVSSAPAEAGALTKAEALSRIQVAHNVEARTAQAIFTSGEVLRSVARNNVAAGAADITKNLPVAVRSSAGWRILVPASKLNPWMSVGTALYAAAVWAAETVAHALYDQPASPAQGAGWRFQYTDTGRFLWSQRSWIGAKYKAITPNGGANAANNIPINGDPQQWSLGIFQNLVIVSTDAWGLTTTTAAPGGWSQGLDTILNSPSTAAQTIDGVQQYGWLLNNQAMNLLQLATIKFSDLNGQQHARFFKLGEASLPAYTGTAAQKTAGLDRMTAEHAGEMMLPPQPRSATDKTPIGAYVPGTVSDVPPGTTCLVEDPNGVPQIGPMPSDAVDPGIIAEPQPTAPPTAVPTAAPTAVPTAVPTKVPVKASDVVWKPVEGPQNFVTRFLDGVSTKFPFDLVADAAIQGEETEWYFVTWQGTTRNGANLERRWSLEGAKPFVKAVLLVGFVGLCVAAFMML